MANNTRVVRLIAVLVVASCWHGGSPQPAPVASIDPPRRQTRPAAPAPSSSASSSPGALALVHQGFDDPSGCLQCHTMIGATAPVSNQKCLACHDHDPIAARIAAKQGFHGLPQVRLRPCQNCHHDHKGRSYDLMGWQAIPGGLTGFDHKLTGWPLPPAYQGMRCTQCHLTVDSQGLQLYLGLDRAQFP